ncbi:hypothetical protein COLU111180_07875 [Cohnella lubricantis]|uniref:Uncharacterized protein n=1 Tax=Cohnella lubricantis TaxID=2163172 RepID=A0A841TFK2_9BACL|nr:hypothetical protein [Cohnella lubricantis]MBB6677727.1 hypothetical protein [Cohnella lubricantis]MBP2117689.1 hypothetical protein [Cohnella lubricantis]
MPSGYAAAAAWAIAVILSLSGWRRELTEGLPRFAVIGYLAGWPFFSRLLVPVPLLGYETAVGASLLWTAAFAIVAAGSLGAAKSGTSCAAGVLIGSAALFTDRVSEALPSLLPASALWVSSAIIAVIAALLSRGAAEQIVTLTIGLTLTEAVSALWDLHTIGQALIGTLAWSDRWWLAYLEIRVFTVAASWLPLLVRRSQWRRGGERS